MKVLLTGSGCRQLRTAIETIHSRDRDRARRFRAETESLLTTPDEIDRRGAPLPEFADLPFREVRIDNYRFFFRAEGNTLWLAGVWNTQDFK